VTRHTCPDCGRQMNSRIFGGSPPATNAAMFEQGAGSTPNEVRWEILDNPSDAGVEKLREVLLPKEHTVKSDGDRGD